MRAVSSGEREWGVGRGSPWLWDGNRVPRGAWGFITTEVKWPGVNSTQRQTDTGRTGPAAAACGESAFSYAAAQRFLFIHPIDHSFRKSENVNRGV